MIPSRRTKAIKVLSMAGFFIGSEHLCGPWFSTKSSLAVVMAVAGIPKDSNVILFYWRAFLQSSTNKYSLSNFPVGLVCGRCIHSVCD